MSEPESQPAPSFLAAILRRRWLFLATTAAAGAALGLFIPALRPSRFRAVETLSVVDPRPGGTSAVDYNLTPVRSYLPLVSSPALAAPCGPALGLPAGAPAPSVRVRMPENTRLLELSFEGRDGRSAAAFVRCVAERAIAENRRLNEVQSADAKAVWSSAVAALREQLARRDAELSKARASGLPRSTRARLSSTLDRIEEGRDAPERAAALERQVARLEEEIGPIERSRDALASALGDAERKEALAGVESASRAFGLVSLSPAVPSLAPSGAPGWLLAVLGGVSGLLLGGFLVLSAPVRS